MASDVSCAVLYVHVYLRRIIDTQWQNIIIHVKVVMVVSCNCILLTNHEYMCDVHCALCTVHTYKLFECILQCERERDSQTLKLFIYTSAGFWSLCATAMCNLVSRSKMEVFFIKRISISDLAQR